MVYNELLSEISLIANDLQEREIMIAEESAFYTKIDDSEMSADYLGRHLGLINSANEAKVAKMCKKIYTRYHQELPAVEPTVSFLSTRFKGPDKDDWHKFKRLMCWIKKTKTDVRIIGADDLLNMIVIIDCTHAVYDDMRGHTGGITSYGTGIIDEKSSKQKMNTRSSTETEHGGTSEYLPKPIFFELFMEAQAYKPNIILTKDNESEIRMLVNGKASCTSNSKHVTIKYFWCTDRIKQGNISVCHCPTEKMIADYMSKPLQGKVFITFRNVIMGWVHDIDFQQ